MSRKPTAEEIEAIKFIFLELPDIIDKVEETINNMTDSEFEEWFNGLDNITLKEKAFAFRNGEKVKWF